MKYRKKAAALIVTLLLFSVSVSGCVTTGGQAEPAPLPPRPTLESMTENEQGGICIDRQDTAELLHYIDALERR